MNVVRPPLLSKFPKLADLQNVVLAKSFRYHHFQKLTLIKLKITYIFLLVKFQTFPPKNFSSR